MSNIPISTETIFKGLFAIAFLPFVLIWFRSFILSGFKKKSFYTLQEGILSAFLFRFLQTIGLIGTILYFISPNHFEWSYMILPGWIRLSGFFLSLLASLLVFWTLMVLGHNFFASLNLNKDHQLISKGLYKWIRHPLYVLFVQVWVGLFLVSGSLLIGIPWILSYIVIFFGRVPKEEKMMIEYFGEEYKEYMSRTGRVLPKTHKTKTSSDLIEK